MKVFGTLSLALVVLLYGMPLSAFAQESTTVFTLPAGTAGEAYRANTATVLRETYHLRLETNSRASVFRWSVAHGEIPAGLIVRTNGTIVGSPRVARAEPYRFQLKVVDVSIPNSAALTLDFSLMISAPQMKLAHVDVPRLVPEPGRTPEVIAEPIAASSANQPLYTPTSGTNASKNSNPSLEFQSRPLSSNKNVYASMLKSDEPGEANNVKEDLSFKGGATASKKPLTAVLHPAPIPLPQDTVKVIVSNEQFTGDKIRGPATIEFQNLNVLRYDIKIGKDVTFAAGPDLKLPFIPPIPSQPQKSNAGGTPGLVAAAAGAMLAAPAAACNSIQSCFRDLIDQLNGIEHAKATNVNGPITQISADVNLAKADVESLVGASDSILATGGGVPALLAALTPILGGGGSPGSINTALSTSWPDSKIEELLGRLNTLKNDLLSLPTMPVAGQSFDNWYTSPGNKAAYDAGRARIEELQTQLAGLKSSSTAGTAIQAAQDKLRLWKPILIGVQTGGPAGFTQVVKVGCSFAFDSTKETKVKIVKRDRLADPGAATTSDEVVTVVCSSPLSISAGFGFSNVDEREFVFVPSTKTTTTGGQTTQTVISRFGFRNKSGFRTLPVLLLNTRIWEPNDTLALHLSTGAAVDIKTGEGGTDVEYIVGPSISFRRSFFITSGLHIGRVPKLAGGFSLDEEVPTGISEPPVEKSWNKGFVATFTYRIR